MEYKLNKRIILASASPRRRQLLSALRLPFEVRVQKGVSERYPVNLPSKDVPEYIAREKAQAYTVAPDELIITADTVVELDGHIFGKPSDEAEAFDMLRQLSGRTHTVVTGVCLLTSEAQRSFSVSTEVTFRDLTEKEIRYYIENYHPLDKAGAYGIQEWIGYVGCVGIKGSFYNVMGFPVQRVYQELTSMLGEVLP